MSVKKQVTDEMVELKLVTCLASLVLVSTVVLNFFDRTELNDICQVTLAGYIGYVGRNSIGGKSE